MARKAESALILILLLGSIFFPATALAGSADTHDLTVSLESLGVRNHLESNTTLSLNSTIRNNGDVTEQGVTFQLLINGSQSVDTVIDELAPLGNYSSRYQWKPTNGVYYVTANVSTSFANNSDTIWVNVCPSQPPQPFFTVSPMFDPNILRKNTPINFDASKSNDPDWGNITWFYWNFGDAKPPENHTDPSVTHSFDSYGNASVTLTVGDTDNLSNSTSKTYLVSRNPVAAFSIWNPPNCKPPLNQGPYYVNNELTFDASNSSVAPGASILSHIWDFGDGSNNVTTDKTVTHVYKDPGNYTVSLTVIDSNNLNSSTIQSAQVVVASPIADFAVSPGPYYVNSIIIFNATRSCDPVNYSSLNPGIANYAWNFGDGISNVATDQNITHKYTYPYNSHDYTVSLTVTDYKGNSGSKNESVTVTSPTLVRIEDGSTGNTVIAYDPGQEFTVNITVTNVVALDYFEFTLKYPNGTPPPLLKGEKISQGYFPLGPKSIDDSQGLITVKSLEHLNGANGSFTLAIINFTVTNPGNCTLYLSSGSLRNSTGGQINPQAMQADFYTEKPVAYFSMDESSIPHGDSVRFDATRSYDPRSPNGTNHGIETYTWDFDDGNVTTVKSPIITHPYTKDGTYYVTLTATDDDGEQWSYRNPKPINVGAIHDVAVVNVTLTTTCFFNITPTSPFNFTISNTNVTVNLKNEGNVEEKFNVTVYGDSYDNTTTAVTIAKQSQTQIVLGWNFTAGLKANCTICAKVALTYDMNQSDNTANNTICLGLACDIDGNGAVGLSDLVILAKAYGSANPQANIDDLGLVGLNDLVLLATHYGTHL